MFAYFQNFRQRYNFFLNKRKIIQFPINIYCDRSFSKSLLICSRILGDKGGILLFFSNWRSSLMFISTLLAIVINVAKAEVGLTIYQLFRPDNYLRKVVTGIFKHNFATLDAGNIHSQGLIGHLRQGDGGVAASDIQPAIHVGSAYALPVTTGRNHKWNGHAVAVNHLNTLRM